MADIQNLFPENWSKLSSKEAVDNINYFLNHNKAAVKRLQDDGSIVMTYDTIDNIRFGKDEKGYFFIGDAFNWYDTYYRAYPDYAAYYPLKQLFDKCKEEVETKEYLFEQLKQKAKIEKRQKRKLLWGRYKIPVMLVVLSIMFIGIRQYQKQKEIDKKVKQYEKTLAGYQEYQQQIANYRDSLQRTNR